jgi:23S rRNA pseudouridine1911/1915/1917 synthase
MNSRETRIVLEATPLAAGRRLDAWLAEQVEGLSRSRIHDLILSGAALVDGHAAKPKHKVAAGERIEIEIPPPEDAVPEPEAIALDVVFEDESLIVINKAAGMVVHPAPGHSSGTLVNALLHHCQDLSGIGGVRRPGIVHRLDQDTSGLLVAAKNDAAHQALSGAMARRDISREYLAVVMGAPKHSSGTVDAPVGRSRTERVKMAIDPKRGRAAVTHWEVDRWGLGLTALKVRLETGRTHQIRVHLASIGIPVAGDRVYGWTAKREKESIPHEASRLIQALSRVDRQQLHAARLSFPHPSNGELMEFSAPCPEDMQALLDAIPPVATKEELIRDAERKERE